MIPPLNDSGYLPAGVHAATLVEIEDRFGGESELRTVIMQSLRWTVALAVRAGVRRIVVDGSFITDRIEPNDVDCVLLFPPGSIKESAAFRELRSGRPFVDAAIVRSDARFEAYVEGIYGTDRVGTPKGVIEVVL